MSLVIERPFFIANHSGPRGGSRRSVQVGVEPTPQPPAGRIPRIAKLMALAIHCDQLLKSGAVPDASTLARLAKVSQPRMTQILNLTLLAPDIQEKLLFLDPVDEGKPEVSEKGLRRVCAEVAWARQRMFFSTQGVRGSV
ncbi:hypothetical protein LBMAG53_19840 [Planctomycetota bacterium]|nr:hypothetical protein LBMAG53_19840 [Planctomycetota bacterium]